jgi:hypothetical protein
MICWLCDPFLNAVQHTIFEWEKQMIRRVWLTSMLVVLLFSMGSPAFVVGQNLQVDADFEGGSVRVIEVDRQQNRIDFMPGGDPVRGWPCWWYFKVDDVPDGASVTLRLQGSIAAIGKQKPLSSAWAMPRRATWSADGKTWQQTEPGERDGPWMIYQVQPKASSFYIAWGPPFVPSDAEQLIQQLATDCEAATAGTLCDSNDGRPVPMLTISEGPRSASQRFGIWIQARQHAWESGSSWVAAGVAKWLCSDDPDAIWLRQHSEIHIVPVMDVDNVATGNGGKNAIPHDHNRDWSESPRWNEVAAAQQHVQRFIDQQRMSVFLDLHNPAPGDPTFFYILPAELLSETAVQRRDRFIDVAYRNISSIRPMVPMSSKPKQTGPKYHPLWENISSNWVAMNGNPDTVSLCLETIWNSTRSTPDGYQAVGTALAASISEFLQAEMENSSEN